MEGRAGSVGDGQEETEMASKRGDSFGCREEGREREERLGL